MSTYLHTLTRDTVVIMPGVDFLLIVDGVVPGLDMAYVRRLFGSNAVPVKASDLIPFD